MKQKCCENIPAPQLPTSEDAALAQLAQALGHPARVAIVRYLQGREGCVCGQIVDQLPLAQSTVSQHLKILKDAGWIHGEIDGPRVCYCINAAAAGKFAVLMKVLFNETASARSSKKSVRRFGGRHETKSAVRVHSQ